MMDFNLLIFTVLACCIVSATCSAAIDKLNFHYNNSFFSKLQNQMYWNPSKSWLNKWDSKSFMSGEPGRYSHWYYFGLYKTSYKEKFIYSSTIFVFFTDAFHTFKFIGNTANQLLFTIAVYNCGLEFVFKPGILIFLLTFLIIKTFYNLVFSICFDHLFKKRA